MYYESSMRVSPELIAPSQDFLKPSTIAFIFDCIERDELDRLPPDPIVRQDTDGALIAIDGHNLIAVKLYRQEEIEVHLASSATDGLPVHTQADTQRNNDLREKFEIVLDERNRVSGEGIASFRDLIKRYPELFL